MSRIPANSYGNGKKYAGGNTFVNADGSLEKVYGYYTSPTGKKTFTYDDERIIVLDGNVVNEIGSVYKDGKIIYKPAKMMSYDRLVAKAEELANGKPVEEFFIEAAIALGGK